MDRNIYYDAEADTSSATDSTNKGYVNWNSGGFATDGPVTAMDYLYNATKDWTSVPSIIINYTDEGNDKYGTIVTTDVVTKITKFDGSTVTVLNDKEGYVDLKARMPYYSEVSNYNAESNNTYLYDNLNASCRDSDENRVDCDANEVSYKVGVFAEGITHIEGIGGYWISCSGKVESRVYASDVGYNGTISEYEVEANSGIRPVITLKI